MTTPPEPASSRRWTDLLALGWMLFILALYLWAMAREFPPPFATRG